MEEKLPLYNPHTCKFAVQPELMYRIVKYCGIVLNLIDETI